MKRKKLRIILKYLKQVVKPRRIILIAILLIGNTYAWFIYSNEVSGGVEAHVRAWNVFFEAGDTTIVDTYNVDITDVYPGMTNFVDTLSIENTGDIAANITYQLLGATIFDTTYVTVEGHGVLGDQADPDDPTSSELEDILANDYPFSITFSLASSRISEYNGITSYVTSLVWPYESGDDEADTYWGKEAYTFRQSNPTSPSITLAVRIFVSQANGSSEVEPSEGD